MSRTRINRGFLNFQQCLNAPNLSKTRRGGNHRSILSAGSQEGRCEIQVRGAQAGQEFHDDADDPELLGQNARYGGLDAASRIPGAGQNQPGSRLTSFDGHRNMATADTVTGEGNPRKEFANGHGGCEGPRTKIMERAATLRVVCETQID